MGGWRDGLTWALGVGAEALLAGTAWRAARRVRGHRPVAAAVSFGLVSDLATRFLQSAWLEGAPRPFSGAVRLIYHADVALVLAWPAALGLLAAATFKPGRAGACFRGWLPAWVPALAWLTAVVGHVAAFPVRGRTMSKVTLAVEAFCLASAGVTVARSWSGKAWRGEHGAMLFLLGTELVVLLLGPFATNIYTDWVVARTIYTASFLSLSAWYWTRTWMRAPARP